ncbi:hypothetical protein LWI28_028598 [Acer negundo]|uniref:Uncharacterized protein n=1 Tax=Acer negundo TaxID=4023 RepID=A0AAD5NVV5_ACENE|nr:hypothetical protein LWI28_028598 [Acer negundo]
MTGTPSHNFYKIILPETIADNKLTLFAQLQRIPEKFVKEFGDELSTFVRLIVPNGRVWPVGLMKDGIKEKMESKKRSAAANQDYKVDDWDIYLEVVGEASHGHVVGLGRGMKPEDVFGPGGSRKS